MLRMVCCVRVIISLAQLRLRCSEWQIVSMTYPVIPYIHQVSLLAETGLGQTEIHPGQIEQWLISFLPTPNR